MRKTSYQLRVKRTEEKEIKINDKDHVIIYEPLQSKRMRYKFNWLKEV